MYLKQRKEKNEGRNGRREGDEEGRKAGKKEGNSLITLRPIHTLKSLVLVCSMYQELKPELHLKYSGIHMVNPHGI